MDERALLEELRAMRTEHRADNQRLHQRIDEVKEGVIELKSDWKNRPCAAHEQQIEAAEGRIETLENRQWLGVAGYSLLSIIAGASASSIWSAIAALFKSHPPSGN